MGTLLKIAKVVVVTGAVMSAQMANAFSATRIVMIAHGQAQDGFWSVVKNGAAEAAKEVGVDLEYRAPETFDMVAMSQLIDAVTNQQPDGLIVSIPDPDALGPSIKRAVAAGIPVISTNSGGDVSHSMGALLHVGQGEYEAGKAAGVRLKELGGKNGLCVNGEVGNVSIDTRCQGFEDGFGGMVKVLPVSFDLEESTAKIVAALAADSSIDSMLATDVQAAGGAALAALEKTGNLGKVHLGSFDLSPDMLKAVAGGNADFVVDQQQYLQGYLPVVFLALYARYGLIPAGDVPSGPNLVTKDTAEKAIELSAKGIR